jgi:hypothetical protein
MKKIFVALRHAKKSPDGFIDPESMKTLEDYCRKGRFNLNEQLITDVFYGPIPRSIQCATHATAALASTGKAHPKLHLHGPIQEIGNSEIFKEIGTPEFMAARKCNVNIFVALEKLHLPEKVKEWEAKVIPGLRMIFSLIQEDGIGFLPGGHIPIIPWWVNSCTYPHEMFKNHDMVPLEGLVFRLKNNGEIIVTDILPTPITAVPTLEREHSEIHDETPVG